jgi:hypothetical protein
MESTPIVRILIVDDRPEVQRLLARLRDARAYIQSRTPEQLEQELIACGLGELKSWAELGIDLGNPWPARLRWHRVKSR